MKPGSVTSRPPGDPLAAAPSAVSGSSGSLRHPQTPPNHPGLEASQRPRAAAKERLLWDLLDLFEAPAQRCRSLQLSQVTIPAPN